MPNPHNHTNQTATATPAPTRGANSVPVAAKQNYVRGKVNHVVVEEAQEAPDMVTGMFFVNDTSVVVLFDSGASHSFIPTAYVEKHNLPIALLKCQMLVSSPEGDMPTDFGFPCFGRGPKRLSGPNPLAGPGQAPLWAKPTVPFHFFIRN
jgi:hypothetical protein